ncbi:hypothetical protein [Sphingomonas abaci]|uniref:Uncharacterized protein n=1 Tax=Sphingomonas abaci TaxID=237611 RepID=A0A7W7AM83_9SPHN|nr:hypothetical protein [Sphingomonas abaci]MBB4619643.1 hypothetical protein [Sphingomonas abaci]
MTDESDEDFFARRAQQEVDLAAATNDPAIKAIHLNLAARYATQRERAACGGSAEPRSADDE